MSDRQVDVISELRKRAEEAESLLKAMEAGNMHPVMVQRFHKAYSASGPIKAVAEETALTPDWLMKHGFEWFTDEITPPAFDVPMDRYGTDCRLLIEKGIHRNQFFMALERNEYTDGSVWYDTEIWMQDNIGCGFNQVPDPNITEWTINRFCALYYALRGESLIKLTINGRDFPQKQLFPPAEDNKIPTE